MSRPRFASLVSAAGLLVAAVAIAPALALPQATAAAEPARSALDAALALVPADAIAFVIVPNPKRASDDLQQCIERMNRPEASLGGRPIDQLKAQLGISASFDDKGPIAISVRAPSEATKPARIVISVPATDPKAFLAGNFVAAPDIAPDAYRRQDGMVLYGKAGANHAHLSNDADAVRNFDPGAGVGAAARARLGQRGAELLAKGDLIAWGSREAMRPALEQAATQAKDRTPGDVPFAAQAKEMQATAMKLLEGLDSGLVVVDFDPLGVGVRTFVSFAPGSELATLAAGGADHETRLDRMPKQPYYFAVRADIDGLGGIGALEALLRTLPGQPALPAWLAGAKGSVHAMQMAIYPSKMGLAVGGLLNDSALFLETDKPDAVRDGLRDAIMSMKGEIGGLRREPAWENDRHLKSGEIADAFEVTETVVAAKDASPGDLSIQRMITQGIYGSRGLVGFVKRQQGGVVMTFSQRADVLERATKTGAGGAALASDATIGAFREWLIDRPEIGRADVEGYVGVGQFGKLFQQVLTLVPGGDTMRVPQIPTSVEPVAFALEIDKGTVETALVIPSGVLAVGFDEIKRQIMGAVPGPAKDVN